MAITDETNLPAVGWAWSCMPCNTVRYKFSDRQDAASSLVTHCADKHNSVKPNTAGVFPHDKSGKPVRNNSLRL